MSLCSSVHYGGVLIEKCSGVSACEDSFQRVQLCQLMVTASEKRRRGGERAVLCVGASNSRTASVPCIPPRIPFTFLRGMWTACEDSFQRVQLCQLMVPASEKRPTGGEHAVLCAGHKMAVPCVRSAKGFRPAFRSFASDMLAVAVPTSSSNTTGPSRGQNRPPDGPPENETEEQEIGGPEDLPPQRRRRPDPARVSVWVNAWHPLLEGRSHCSPRC
ncbi:uncharacterized protein LOC118206634 isoform X3 [Anguilla anguilla]|uniref:uncharacterized protein LOC118206634 isoform X3 n=1 Tax=Anguilla anguilla TaxID=7936 RepID=UPI0015ADD486|nr:uncharacterized protein LOC118206634 isoform X3 [Anguilla anguilla]